MKISDYKRIIIIGSPGSGKSYLSNKIAKFTGYNLIHLDNEFWNPNWVKTPKAEWIEKQKEFLKPEKWVVDGHYGSTLELRFEKSDMIIFLDINVLTCLYRVIKRHGKKRLDLPEYLEEKYDKEFFCFLKYICSFRKNNILNIISLKEKYSNKLFIRLNSRKQVENFFNELEK
ncbi:MAG: topology modulation protein [Oscillospiraceae bacterium]